MCVDVYNVDVYNVDVYNVDVYNVDVYNVDVYNVDVYNVDVRVCMQGCLGGALCGKSFVYPYIKTVCVFHVICLSFLI